MKIVINPGEFKHLITFQKLVNTKNSYGETTNNWKDIITSRCAIYPISGKELLAAESVSSEVTHKINMRFARGISHDMRIKFNNRVFSIISIINFQEKNKLLQIIAKELI
ncbi:MAG: phage head closure protein [Clostridium sp.]